MKLASYKDGSRDGQLLVVSRDLTTAHYATGIASRLQQALDDWNFISPQLQDLYDALNGGKARHAFAFEPAQCMAPLPRAYQRADGAAYLNHAELLSALSPASTEGAAAAVDGPAPATGGVPPPTGAAGRRASASRKGIMMYQGGSDDFLGPCDDIRVASEDFGIDFGAELAVVTGDVPMAATPEQGLDAVRLLMLANDVSLRALVPDELARGFGFFHSKPATAFGPVAVTPDELGDAWQGGRVHLSLQVSWNGRKVCLCEAGPEMHFHFGQLIAHAARTRRLCAGSIIGSGTVSNAGVETNGRREWPKGYACIAEKRAMETLQDGAPRTEYMRFGDSVRIEMKGRGGESVFGAIEQVVAPSGD